ncbi:MAG: hypothetical protein AAB851_00255 [Patescibacteria group bacterium]
MAYIEKLTVGVGLILVIPLGILSGYLEKIVFKKENGDGNN